MNVNKAELFCNWTDLKQGQRWLTKNQVISLGNERVHPWLYQRISSSQSSLSSAIQEMNRQLSTVVDDPNLPDPQSRLALQNAVVLLQKTVNAKIKSYNQKHCRIYLLFMRCLGRDANNAKLEFDRQCEALKGKWNFGSKIPVDCSYKLRELIEDPRFDQFNDDLKKSRVGKYVHLIPLAEFLNYPLKDLAELILVSRDSITDLAILLIRQAKGWTLERDLKQILSFLDQCGLDAYVYHGTNVHAMQLIQQYGFGSSRRDYDVDLLRRVGATFGTKSNLDLNTFWVAGSASESYGYANSSPEWWSLRDNRRLVFSNETERSAYSELVKKYDQANEACLIQMRFPSRRAISPYLNLVESGELPPSAVVSYLIEDSNSNKIHNSDFFPISMAYYRLPRLRNCKD